MTAPGIAPRDPRGLRVRARLRNGPRAPHCPAGLFSPHLPVTTRTSRLVFVRARSLHAPVPARPRAPYDDAAGHPEVRGGVVGPAERVQKVRPKTHTPRVMVVMVISTRAMRLSHTPPRIIWLTVT